MLIWYVAVFSIYLYTPCCEAILTVQYTYGSPKVVNEALAEYITAQGTLYRVTHTNDIAPKVPPGELGFNHPGPEYWVTGGNGDTVGTQDVEVIQGTNSTKGNAGAVGASVAAHFFYFEDIYACF